MDHLNLQSILTALETNFLKNLHQEKKKERKIKGYTNKSENAIQSVYLFDIFNLLGNRQICTMYAVWNIIRLQLEKCVS